MIGTKPFRLEDDLDARPVVEPERLVATMQVLCRYYVAWKARSYYAVTV